MPLSNLQVIHNDRYRIEALLGQGGMGAVYRGMDLSLNIPVAIKENLDGSPYPPRKLNRNISPMAEGAILKAIEVATERRRADGGLSPTGRWRHLLTTGRYIIGVLRLASSGSVVRASYIA